MQLNATTVEKRATKQRNVGVVPKEEKEGPKGNLTIKDYTQTKEISANPKDKGKDGLTIGGETSGGKEDTRARG